MISTTIDWYKLITIVNSLAGPLVTSVLVVAAVMFFRSNRSLPTLGLLIGCVMIFLQRIVYAIVWLPGIGYVDRADHVHSGQIAHINSCFAIFNLIAWLFFVSGLLQVARKSFKASLFPTATSG